MTLDDRQSCGLPRLADGLGVDLAPPRDELVVDLVGHGRHEHRRAREGACRKRPERLTMGAMTEHAVAIAGGGPTGLMLAGELALAGVDVVIVERRATQDVDGSRARG